MAGNNISLRGSNGRGLVVPFYTSIPKTVVCNNLSELSAFNAGLKYDTEDDKVDSRLAVEGNEVLTTRLSAIDIPVRESKKQQN